MFSGAPPPANVEWLGSVGRPDFMELSMHNAGSAERNRAVALLAVEDEDAASRSPARLLIPAPTQQGVDGDSPPESRSRKHSMKVHLNAASAPVRAQ